MAAARMLSSNTTPVQPPLRNLLVISRVHHPTTRNFKLSVPQSGQDGLNVGAAGKVGIEDDDMTYLICPLSRTCADLSSFDGRRSMINGGALKQLSSALTKRPNIFRIVPFCKMRHCSVLLGCVYCTPFTRKQQLLRPKEMWIGYWIGPEDVDGWGFVEAYLLPM